jgi:hypothetical protein
MKQGLSLVDMATQLESNRKVARDFVADTRKLTMTEDATALSIAGQGKFALTPHAQRQLAAKLDIPTGFYDRLKGRHPDLLANTVNALFEREPAQNMVRTLPGVARAVVSNGYRTLDNYDLFDAIFPVLRDAKAQVESCNLSDTLLQIKVLCPWLDRELPMPEGLKMGVGHNFFVRRVQGAMTVKNSEVGAGGLSILPGIFENQCTNLATYKSEGLVKVHLGKRIKAEDAVQEHISDNTRRLDDAAFWSLCRDQVKAVMDGKVFDKLIAKMTAARNAPIVGDPNKVVEVFAEAHGLNQEEKGGLLRHLVGAGEMTQYGLQWAVTRLSQDVADYDRASDLERLGGQVIELPRSQWQELAEAA